MNHSGHSGVSVVIPVYNRPVFLKEAIESVLAQAYADYEIIVVDDGSTDDTPEVIREFDDRIVSIRQENRGVSAARNTGIRKANHEFIAFLDSDDLWMKDKLSHQINYFQENPEARICQTGEIWVRRGKRVNPGNKHVKPSGMIFDRSLNLCLVSPSAVMLRKNVFEEFGLFDEDLPACEDYDLWLRISCRIPIFLTDRELVIKRGGHEGQLSSMDSLDKYRIRSIVRLIESGNLNSFQTVSAAKVLMEKCGIYASGCRKRGKTDEADEVLAIYAKYAGFAGA